MSEGEIKIQLRTIVDRWRFLNAARPQIPELIKALRQARGISQAQLGAILEVDKTYISQIERGEREASLALLEKVLAYLEE